MLLIFIILVIILSIFFYNTEHFDEKDFIKSLKHTNYEKNSVNYYNVLQEEQKCPDRNRDCVIACLNRNNELDNNCYNKCLITAYNC